MKKYIWLLLLLNAIPFIGCKKFLDEKQVSNLTRIITIPTVVLNR